LRQYDLYESPSSRRNDVAPYVVILQSHFLPTMPSIVIAPLLRSAMAERLTYLSVDVRVDREDFVIALHELLAVSIRSLRRRVGDVLPYQDAIERGLQRLFTGF
jgi:hypothetical protein